MFFKHKNTLIFATPSKGNIKGPVAEWLGRALQKLPQRFESARDLQNAIRITIK